MGLDSEYHKDQTPLEEVEREGLLIKTITTREELDQMEQLHIEKTIVWLIHKKFSKDRILSEEFVKDLHRKMFGEIWSWAGTFRKTEKNLGIEWTRIRVELKKLLDDTSYWIKHHVYTQDEVAIRFKHRLVKIHCFPNGNGRHSRLMADVIIENIYGGQVFSWKQSNLLRSDKIRREYIQAIQKADQGSIEPLIQFARS